MDENPVGKPISGLSNPASDGFRRLFHPGCRHRNILFIPKGKELVWECAECGVRFSPSLPWCPVCRLIRRERVRGVARIIGESPEKFVCEDCGVTLLL